MFAVIESDLKNIVQQLCRKPGQNDLETDGNAPWVNDQTELGDSSQNFAIGFLSHF